MPKFRQQQIKCNFYSYKQHKEGIILKKIYYRKLNLDECEKIKEINPTQFISKAWREVEGIRQLINIDYLDEDWPNGYDYHINHLKDTIINNGASIGAFENEKLIGFFTVNSQIFGEKYKYVLLDQLFIDLNYRNKGIGKKLFNYSMDEAKKLGAEKLYICAGSAEETIAFYFSRGCTEAIEINKELYEIDKRDFQLEKTL